MERAVLQQESSTPTMLYSYLYFNSKTLYLFISNYNVIIITWASVGTVISTRSMRYSDIPLYSHLSSNTFIGTSGAIVHSSFLSATPFHCINVVKGFSLSMVWVMIVALGFSISNQRRPASIREDTLNKPWRPLPSQRISPSQTSTLLVVTNIVGLSYSSIFGGLGPYLIQLAASCYYNDLGGAQGHHFIRDFLNAIGMTSWLFGCIDVASSSDFRFSTSELYISVMLVTAITTTIAIQDFRDLEGDRICGRATLPIVVGHGVARVTLATSIMAWSFGIPIVLQSGLLSALTGLGMLITVRLLLLRHRSADKITIELWYGWFALLSLALL